MPLSHALLFSLAKHGSIFCSIASYLADSNNGKFAISFAEHSRYAFGLLLAIVPFAVVLDRWLGLWYNGIRIKEGRT